MKTIAAIASSALKFLKGAAILTIIKTIGTTSYYLYEISMHGDPTMTPSSRIPLFLMIGGLVAALGFLIASIFKNQKMRMLLERLIYQERENAAQRARTKELENPLGYELLEDPYSP